MIIHCPYCGKRSASEFTYGGDATVERPDDYSPEAQQQWLDYIFYRDNPRGEHLELWHHAYGCRAWLQVKRNTLTHEILSVSLKQNPVLQEGDV